jgi:hypothetical protein
MNKNATLARQAHVLSGVRQPSTSSKQRILILLLLRLTVTHELRHKAVRVRNSDPTFRQKEEVMKSTAKMMFSLAFAMAVVVGASTAAPALEVGDKAPDFELESSKGGKLKLSSLKGKNVLINFYVLDFSPT